MSDYINLLEESNIQTEIKLTPLLMRAKEKKYF
jgi:hypothetical protein